VDEQARTGDESRGGERRGRLDRLLGAEASAPQTSTARSPRPEAPPAVRRAALVVAVESAVLVAVAGVLLFLTLTSDADSVGRALAEVVYVLLGGAALAACAVGLWGARPWARGPVVVLQILLGVLGYTTAFDGGRPLIGLPVLALVATEIYLLATPEARLAYSER
jgi:hypothetical protein